MSLSVLHCTEYRNLSQGLISVLILIPVTGQDARRPRRQEAKRLQGAEAPTSQPRAPTNQPRRQPTNQGANRRANQPRRQPTKQPRRQPTSPRRRTRERAAGRAAPACPTPRQPGGQPAANKRPTKGRRRGGGELLLSLAPPLPAIPSRAARPPTSDGRPPSRDPIELEGDINEHREHRSKLGTLLPAREERTLRLLRGPSLRRHAAITPPSFRHHSAVASHYGPPSLPITGGTSDMRHHSAIIQPSFRHDSAVASHHGPPSLPIITGGSTSDMRHHSRSWADRRTVRMARQAQRHTNAPQHRYNSTDSTPIQLFHSDLAPPESPGGGRAEREGGR